MRKSDVLEFFGGNQSAVARALNIGRNAVDKWEEVIPPLRAKQLHQLTSGALKFEAAQYAHIPRWSSLAVALSSPRELTA